MANPPSPTSGHEPLAARTAGRPCLCLRHAGCARRTTSAWCSPWSRTPRELASFLAYNITHHRWQREVPHRNVSTISNWLVELCLVRVLHVPAAALLRLEKTY